MSLAKLIGRIWAFEYWAISEHQNIECMDKMKIIIYYSSVYFRIKSQCEKISKRLLYYAPNVRGNQVNLLKGMNYDWIRKLKPQFFILGNFNFQNKLVFAETTTNCIKLELEKNKQTQRKWMMMAKSLTKCTKSFIWLKIKAIFPIGFLINLQTL